MLWHLMNKFHLNHATDLLTFVSQNQFCNLLIAHIRRSVNFCAQIFNFDDALRLRDFNCTFFDQRKICPGILEDTKAGASGCAISSDFHGLILECDHRLGEHDCGLLPTKSIK